jgi:hypothetical protein
MEIIILSNFYKKAKNFERKFVSHGIFSKHKTEILSFFRIHLNCQKFNNYELIKKNFFFV